MMKLVGWAQSIVTFQGGASTHLDGVAFIFRVHLVLGMTIFLLFPFTRWCMSGARRLSTLLVGIRLCVRGVNSHAGRIALRSPGHLQAMIVLQPQENVNETASVPRRCFLPLNRFAAILPVLFSPADNLSEAQMQLIARELGHSETAFLLHSDDSDVRIRYFTPTV